MADCARGRPPLCSLWAVEGSHAGAPFVKFDSIDAGGWPVRSAPLLRGYVALHRTGPIRDWDRPPQRLGSEGDGGRRADARAGRRSHLSGWYAARPVESAALQWPWLFAARVSALL